MGNSDKFASNVGFQEKKTPQNTTQATTGILTWLATHCLHTLLIPRHLRCRNDLLPFAAPQKNTQMKTFNL